MADTVYILTEQDRQELLRLRRKLANIIGAGVVNSPEGVSIASPASLLGSLGDIQPDRWFWAKITGSASIGTNRWKYAWTEQRRTSTGFENLTSGRTGTTSTDFAINSVEANNDGTGIQGNSVDIDGTIFDDNTGLELQAVRGDPVVRMWVDTDADGNTAFTFEYVNAIDGECAA